MARVVDERLVRDAPKSPEALLSLLFDGLDWPKPRHLEIADVPLIEFEPSELHLRTDVLARLISIQQLPPLVAGQPFGVFILQFDGGRLPIGAVRRVLNSLVRKKRGSARGAAGLWGLEDLIFFCQMRDSSGTLHVANFRESGALPVLRVISWSSDATPSRLERVATEHLAGLVWPDSSPDVDAWRSGWSTAFTVGYRQGIRSAAELADKMAEVAREIRAEVVALHEVESEYGPMRALYRSVKDSLSADMDLQAFADMYAQTMVYGLLTARISSPEDFEADALGATLRFDNDFLDALYSGFRRAGDAVFDSDEFGLHDLADLLSRTNMDEVLADFGAADHKEDPVVFFYEEFLERYDPEQRRLLGAYYTPIPIVRGMVKAVDEVLKQDFGLGLGVADDTTWAEFAAQHGCAVPDGVAADSPVVQMIDPATGTGTFLLEWLRRGRENLASAGKDSSDRVAAMAEQMTAFEISLSAYAVAHLKMRMQLPPESRRHADIGVLLTNTLASDVTPSGGLLGEDPIARESALAEAAKKDLRHFVAIGNPPYKDKSKGLGPAVEKAIPGRAAPLLADFTPSKDLGLGAHTKILRNLYVFFWRWALHTVLGDPPWRLGIVAFITPSAWLTGPVFETMRAFVRDGHKVWIIDLGGDPKTSGPDDENVFTEVQIATSICIVARVPSGETSLRYRQLRGSRASKYAALASLSVDDDGWTALESSSTHPISLEKSDEWSSFVALGQAMPFHANGIHQQRTWVNDPNPNILRSRWRRFVSAAAAERPLLLKETSSRKVTSSGRDLVTGQQLPPLDGPLPENPASIIRYSYRTLDRQWLIADSRLIDRPSPELWQVQSDRQIFLNELHSHPVGEGPAISVAGHIPNLHHFHGRGGRVIPLFRDGAGAEVNLLPGLLQLLAKRMNASVDPQQVVAYIVGLLAFPAFSREFAVDLEEGGVRVPLTLDQSLFLETARLGYAATWLFTYGERSIAPESAGRTLRISDGPRLASEPPFTVMPEKEIYDSASETLKLGSILVENVRPDVWSYQVSGMPVVKKWIGYRRAIPKVRYSSPLNDDVTDAWQEEWTEELLDLLHVLTQLRDLESAHADLLARVRRSPLLSHADLIEAGLLPPPQESTRPVPLGTL